MRNSVFKQDTGEHIRKKLNEGPELFTPKATPAEYEEFLKNATKKNQN
jgi:hypothetical protein